MTDREEEMTLIDTIRRLGCRFVGMAWVLAMIWIALALTGLFLIKSLGFFWDTLNIALVAYFGFRIIVWFAGGRTECDESELFPNGRP